MAAAVLTCPLLMTHLTDAFVQWEVYCLRMSQVDKLLPAVQSLKAAQQPLQPLVCLIPGLSLSAVAQALCCSAVIVFSWCGQSDRWSSTRWKWDRDAGFSSLTFYFPPLFWMDQADWVLAVWERIINTAPRSSAHALNHLSEPRQVSSTEVSTHFNPLWVLLLGRVVLKERLLH